MLKLRILQVIYTAISEGGTMEWDTTAFGKQGGFGVYMILYRRRTEWKPKLKKVMIVR
jgi:hypothetical protein